MEQLKCRSRSAVPGEESCRRLQLPGMPLTSHVMLILYTFIAYTAESSGAFILAETLCGGELVDTLQFICGDRGFYVEKNTGRSNRRSGRGIVEECCFRSCDLELLEMYCAKPVKNERDLSIVPSTAMPPLSKDMYHKHSHTKYSKYDIWQRKATQRLRRGVPAIVRARHYRWQVQQVEESQQVLSHRPLTTLPVTQPRPVHQGLESTHN
ncbi:insulin-like growth factor II isoform X2 [Pseudophryne corroboree]|uniref:insulin-like growth factor II isoform X2 n=1 Tax=Pseudophryne corroboree TaxID=495146 RepID=UPI003081BDCB